jgi:RHS repeat-associated protein
VPAEGTDFGTSGNRYAHTSHRYDTESELYYAGARCYSPETGRFITQDTLALQPDQPGTWNLYAYGRANPLRYIDPTGHSDEDANALAAAMHKRTGFLASDHRPAYEKSWTQNFLEELSYQIPTRALPMTAFEGLAQQDPRKIVLGMAETAVAAALGVAIKVGGKAAIEKLVERVPVLGREVGDLVASGAQRARQAITGVVREGERLLSAEVTLDPSVVSMGGLPGVRVKVPPRASTTAGGGTARGGIGPVLKGQAGEALSEAEAVAAGETVVGRQVTFELPSGRRTRPDLLTEPSSSGGLKIREAKHGPSAQLTRPQQELQGIVQGGGAVIPRGSKASKAGLTPGEPVKIKHFEEDRF